MDYSLGLLCPKFSKQIIAVVAVPSPGSSQPGPNLTWQEDSFTHLSNTGSPRILWSGSLSPSQGMDLPDSGIKPGLLHYRWILYQPLSYQEAKYTSLQ